MIDEGFRNMHMSGASAGPPLIVMLGDIRKLNDVERLADSSVPLRDWLEEAAFLTQTLEQGKLFRAALGEVGAKANREPDLPPAAELPEIKEKIVHRDDTVPVGFLSGGAVAAQSVALLKVPRYEDGQAVTDATGSPMLWDGTAWVAAARLLVTNHHVIEARNSGEPPPAASDLELQCAAAEVVFGYDDDARPGTAVKVQELAATDPELDYAVLRLAEDAPAAPLVLASALVQHSPNRHIPLNIVQHPGGKAKRAAIRNNLVTAATDTELRYFTDTRAGSSGSPVLDDRWRVVGLHRAARSVDDVDFQGRDTAWVNVGTQLAAILAHLEAHHPAVRAELTAG